MPNTKDPRENDYGQFRVRCTYTTFEKIVETLIQAGYTVTARHMYPDENKYYIHFGFFNVGKEEEDD